MIEVLYSYKGIWMSEQIKGSQDIERTTLSLLVDVESIMDLTLNLVTSKSEFQ